MVRGRHGSDGWMHAYGLTEDGFIGFTLGFSTRKISLWMAICVANPESVRQRGKLKEKKRK
jgi:hypothetical protein